jgi:hypothetical protein
VRRRSRDLFALAVVRAVRQEKLIQARDCGEFPSSCASTSASRKQGMVSQARRSAPDCAEHLEPRPMKCREL